MRYTTTWSTSGAAMHVEVICHACAIFVFSTSGSVIQYWLNFVCGGSKYPQYNYMWLFGLCNAPITAKLRKPMEERDFTGCRSRLENSRMVGVELEVMWHRDRLKRVDRCMKMWTWTFRQIVQHRRFAVVRHAETSQGVVRSGSSSAERILVLRRSRLEFNLVPDTCWKGVAPRWSWSKSWKSSKKSAPDSPSVEELFHISVNPLQRVLR